MSFRKTLLPLIATVGLSSGYALAADDIKVTAGLKYWNQDMNITDLNRASTSDTAPAPMLSLGVRYGQFFGSVSQLLKTRYTFDNPALQDPQDRSETDIGLGYYIIPQLAVTLAYKNLKQDIAGATPCSTKIKTPTVGLSGAIPFNQSFFGYGNGSLAVGSKVSDNCRAGGSNFEGKPKYTTLEFGAGYRFNNNMTFTAGYRRQEVKVNVIGRSGTADETGKGLIVGASYTF
jgi:predicted porin